jgi:hypothetical protein
MRVNKVTPEYLAGSVAGGGLGIMLAVLLSQRFEVSTPALILVGLVLVTAGSFWVSRVQLAKHR